MSPGGDDELRWTASLSAQVDGAVGALTREPDAVGAIARDERPEAHLEPGTGRRRPSNARERRGGQRRSGAPGDRRLGPARVDLIDLAAVGDRQAHVVGARPRVVVYGILSR